jgi:hypothetical protein
MKTYKVRIKKSPTMDMGGEMLSDYNPSMAYGGQIGWGLDLNSRRYHTDSLPDRQDSMGKVLGPVDRDEATYEAEKGEVIIGDFDRDGQKETMTFGGKPHSQGGTPAKEPGFIYSKTKKMALGGPIIEEFGKTPGKKYTPADLAKQYDLSKYKAILDDPNADPIAKRTAQLMTDNYKKKLGKLAFVQESVKGFPQGVPQVAAEAYPELAAQVQQQMGQMQEEPQMYEGGGSKGAKPPRVPVFDKEYMKYLTGLNNDYQSVALGMNANSKDPNRFTLPTIQSRNSSQVYGDENWWDDEHQADFKKRHDWYLKDAPGWDPRTPGATAAFQNAYDQRMENLGINPYFQGQGFRSKDDKFGEYTYSAPGFERKMATVNNVPNRQVGPVPVNIKAPSIPVNTTTQQQQQQQEAQPGQSRLPYNAFDVANLMSAITTPVKSYGPRMFLPDVREVEGVYDQADYNPLLAAANTRAQMNNTFANTSAAMAANTYNPEMMQGLIQETGRARGNNLQMANQLSQTNTTLRNQSNALNAQLQQDNYDKWVKTQEERDIAEKLKWRKDVVPAAQNMVNNRINMQRYNMMYPEYAVTGPLWDQIKFQRGYSLNDNPSTSGYGNVTFEQFIGSNPGLNKIYNDAGTKSDDKIRIHQMYQNFLNQRMSMYGKNPRNVSANAMNPSMANLMGMPNDPEDYRFGN